MSGAIGKVVPATIVAAIATWCCWPYLDEAAFGEAGAKTYSPQVLHVLLTPAIASEPSRDPFHIVGTAPSLGAPKEREAAGTKASGDSRSTPKNAAPQKDAAGMAKGLTLSGTYLAGNRRAALINGRLWEQGQRLELSKNAAEPWVLAEVSPFGVVIASGGKSFELKYPGPEERPAGIAKIAEAAAPPPARRANSAVQSNTAVQSKPARQSPPARTAPTAKAGLFKPSK